jgi:hypothetical protein
MTLFFTDRPQRIAGNMKTTAFIPFWSEGKDSFKSNPPNADISILEGKTLKQVVVVLQDPVLSGDNLTYTVKVLQGEMPATGADVSVFIDIIGRPLTPISTPPSRSSSSMRRERHSRTLFQPSSKVFILLILSTHSLLRVLGNYAEPLLVFEDAL